MKRKVLTILLCSMLGLILLAGCAKKAEPKDSKAAASDNKKFTAVTTAAVKAALDDDRAVVLDARANDAYIGWTVDGAKRGGHIAGAVDFAASWLTCDYDDKENLEGKTREEVLTDAIENKKLREAAEVIVYDTNGKDAAAVAEYLDGQGIKGLKVYDANEWLDDTSLPLESYPNYQLLVPAGVVKTITEGKTPDGFTDSKNIVVVDVRWGEEKESGYLDGHIPTAVHINTDSFEPPKEYVDGIEEWRLADDDTLLKLLLKNGISADTCVIATSPEPMAASRFAVICQYLGVKDVRVMNSGFVGWSYAGYDLDKTAEKAVAVTDFGSEKVPAQPDLIDTMAELKTELKSPDFQLIDNRTWEEYIGKSSGYSYHKKAGRIEGAIFGYGGIGDSSSMYYYRNIDKSPRNMAEVEAMWKECGIDTSKHMSFMCGSGWRAAEVLWQARVMGYENTSLYSDGWIAWSNEGNPAVKGEPK